ncbi:MAG: TIGR04013 family B12-binding domain/radical SAM domain-containing protein [Archangiaceae bacterium]|nr:TIGR04013 family B12-binding domain/radical SAM domain-containing protein [Archangiaceae bacterium]
MRVSTTFIGSTCYPAKAAMAVLAGAIEERPELKAVSVRLARNLEELHEELSAALARADTTLVGFSFYSPSFPEALAQLNALKAAHPTGWTSIAGGVHATAETEAVLDAGFDLVCVGEGERAIIDLLTRARDGLPLQGALGFAWRGGRGPKPAPVDLNDFPPFAPQTGLYGAIELTRGCIYACRFCQTPFMSKARFRHRSVENVRHWVRVMVASGRRDARFISPTSLSYGSADASVNLDAVEALLAACRGELGRERRLFFGTFPSEVRPEHVTPEALKVLKRWVDNDNLIIGGQSGSDAVLRESRRGHDAEAIVRAARICVENGFVPNVDFIFGLPGEGPSQMRETVALMNRLAELGAKVHGHTFMPLPGTPFREAPPGDVPLDVRTELDRLASQGRLYGHWRAQIATARELAERRSS